MSIPPQKYFVESIGGNTVSVSVMAGQGADPHMFEPLPRQMMELAEAQLYFTIGMPFEDALLTKIRSVNPRLQVIDTRSGIPLRPAEAADELLTSINGEDEQFHYSMGHKTEHSHGSYDPHIWLSPALAKIQARTIYNALNGIDPDTQDMYAANYNSFCARMDSLSEEIETLLAPLKGRAMLVFHPSWGYFADQFGFVQIPIEFEGREPNPRRLAVIISYAKHEGIRAVFVQPQIHPRSAEVIAREIGGVVVSLDPLAENYCDNLRNTARLIRDTLMDSQRAPANN